MDGRGKKVSTLIFLFALFMLLAVILGAWLFKIYQEQTKWSDTQTVDAVDCGRYYYQIGDITYHNGTLSFMFENTVGKPIKEITIESAIEKRSVNMSLNADEAIPISVPLQLTDWVFVYPSACRGFNFKNISFLPNENESYTDWA
ncbi:hypothetical protein ACFL0V_04165 [Nanoarchaeota archaeon]